MHRRDDTRGVAPPSAAARYHRPVDARELERPRHLRSVVRAVAGLLIDVDGVLVQQERPLAGAAEALRLLAARGIPFRLATNTSLVSRATLARQAGHLGLDVAPAQILSALSATAALTRRRFPHGALYVLCSPDARTEFAGQRLLEPGDADAHHGPDAHAGACAAVVIGDAPEALTYENLDRAFRLVRGGARLVAMHRNPWWLTPRGPTLDAGAFVVGLEYATRRRALLAGKPAPAFFREAARELDLPPARVAIVGDDLVSDIAGGQRAGLRAIWVRSGRHATEDLAARLARGARPPDAIAPDLITVVRALVG
jgi:HAD superfamily hydrolase (TIGR01450 family)